MLYRKLFRNPENKDTISYKLIQVNNMCWLIATPIQNTGSNLY